jgi:hypothetical protein
MLQQEGVFRAEQAACQASFDQIDWGSDALVDAWKEMSCSECGSNLIKNKCNQKCSPIDMILLCSECGHQLSTEDELENAVEQTLYYDDYISMTDGGDSPLDDCLECGKRTFVVKDSRCAICEYSIDEAKCAVCYTLLTPDDVRYGDNGLCSYHQWSSEKND